jgi:hypothetical protein
VAANRGARGARRPVLASASLSKTVSKSSHCNPPDDTIALPNPARQGDSEVRSGAGAKSKTNTTRTAAALPNRYGSATSTDESVVHLRGARDVGISPTRDNCRGTFRLMTVKDDLRHLVDELAPEVRCRLRCGFSSGDNVTLGGRNA